MRISATTSSRRWPEWPNDKEPTVSWDERYAEPGWAYGTEPNDFLVEAAARIPAGSVLCLGEGEGRNAAFLAGRGHPVLGVDQSPVGLAKAEALARERGVTIATVVADLTAYRIEPGAWSGIVSIWIHLLPAARATLHRAVVAGLAPGGAFVLEAYAPRQIEFGTGGPPEVEKLISLSALSTELAGLEFEIAREIERDVHEGRLHHGRSAVVQIVARKPG